MNVHVIAAFCILCVVSQYADAGTWLSFNQKTGGIDADIVPQTQKFGNQFDHRMAPSRMLFDEGDLMRLIKVCNDELTKRSATRAYNREERRDAEMCRSVMEFVARK